MSTEGRYWAGKLPSVEMVRGAGEGLKLLWSGLAGPVSVLLDHTEHLVLRSLAEACMLMAMMHLVVYCLGFFPHFVGSFSSLYFSSYWEFGAKFTVLLLNICLGVDTTREHGHLLQFLIYVGPRIITVQTEHCFLLPTALPSFAF